MIPKILTQPYFINFIYQKIFRLNSSASFSVHFTSLVCNGENIKVSGITKKYLAKASGMVLHGLNGIEIGEGTIIAPGVQIWSTSHNIEDYSKLFIGEQFKVTIGKRCWLGAQSIILPGVVLGDNIVVSAGSVVTKSFADNHIIAGVPAKIVRKLNNLL